MLSFFLGSLGCNVATLRKSLVFCLCLGSLSGCPRQLTRTLTAPRPQNVDATLGPGDLFDVRVFGEADLSGSYRVGPDGIIDYPLVGRVEVSGKLPSELALFLRTRLATYVHEPQVSVLVKEMNSKRVTVYGQVARPGTFPYTNVMTISQVISLAGGFTAMAARERVLLSRFEKNAQQITEVNCLDIAGGKAANQFVSPGDEVYVPERLF
jgi:protein involved in polysaccharide export with SLBB domain